MTYSFYGCASLKEAILPESLSRIGSCAFCGCTSLEKVYIPQSTRTLGSQAFLGDSMLSEVTFSDYSIKKIESQTFKDCPALESIVLPKGLTAIGDQAFMNDTLLFDVTIPESVTSIGSNAFSYPFMTTIHGVAGSYAETYAVDGEFTFDDITIPAEGLSLIDGIEDIVIDYGDTYHAVFEFYPDDTTDVVAMTSSNNSALTINQLDLTAKARSGECTVTAATRSGLSWEFTVHFRDARSISIASPASKLIYNIGEEFDTSGLVLEVQYNDSSTREVNNYTVSGFDSSAEGGCTVTLSWVSHGNSTFSTSFDVEIVDPRPKLTGIEITSLPNKREYLRRESLDLTGLVVVGHYTDDSTAEITDYTVSGYNALKNGVQTITVSCGGFSDTFTVSVVESLTVKGDADGDGEITVADALIALRVAAKLAEATPDRIAICDADGDGEITVADALKILRVAAKLADSL